MVPSRILAHHDVQRDHDEDQARRQQAPIRVVLAIVVVTIRVRAEGRQANASRQPLHVHVAFISRHVVGTTRTWRSGGRGSARTSTDNASMLGIMSVTYKES